MAEARVDLLPGAEAEITNAVDWYAARSLVAASAFVHELDLVIRKAVEAPERWPQGNHGTRCLVFPRFPFTLIYRFRPGIIDVVAVAHQRRRPGYWKRR